MAERFVGIDLSVCNIVVSASSKDEPSAVAVAVNDVSNRSTPASVGFDGCLRLVGESAETKVTQLPKAVVTSVPAILGSKELARKNYERFGCLYNFSEDGKVGPMQFGTREDLSLEPAAVLAPLLRTLVSYATGKEAVGKPTEDAPQAFELAIGAPDGWTDAELSTVRGAVDILGWKSDMVHVLPYSAALTTAYTQRIGQKLGADEETRTVLFVDIGYSQTSLSVSKFTAPAADAESQDLKVEAFGCSDGKLGTHTFCHSLMGHVNKQIEAKGGEPVALASKRGARLMTALQKSMKELSMLKDTTLALECFFPDESDLKVDFSRALFEDVIKPDMDALVALVNKALDQAGIKAEDVHSVELVGGGMRIPKVQQLLSEMFPSPAEETAEAENGGKVLSKRLRFSLDGASAVANGAAHYAAGRRGLESKWKLAEQTSSLDEAAVSKCREEEEWMVQTNATEEARLAKSNELESYIFEVRSMLSGPDRSLLGAEKTEPLLEEVSRWFEDAQYEEGTTLEMFEEKLSGLKSALQEHGKAYFEKKEKEREARDKMLDEAAEAERQRRHELGMDADKDDRKMAKSERMKLAAKNKEEGNVVFKAGNLEDAAGRYQRALQHINKFFMLDVSPEDKAEANALTLSVQLNLAQVYLKLAAQAEKDQGKDAAEPLYQKVKSATTEALKIDENNVKARFRLASALERLGDLDGAQKEVKMALKVDAENTDLQKLKERLEKLQAAQNAKAKKMYGKMFG